MTDYNHINHSADLAGMKQAEARHAYENAQIDAYFDKRDAPREVAPYVPPVESEGASATEGLVILAKGAGVLAGVLIAIKVVVVAVGAAFAFIEAHALACSAVVGVVVLYLARKTEPGNTPPGGGHSGGCGCAGGNITVVNTTVVNGNQK
jgi:hypothetical protein